MRARYARVLLLIFSWLLRVFGPRNSPAAVIAGPDPQLEKAIEVLMADLKKNPPVKPKRPAYPYKVVP